MPAKPKPNEDWFRQMDEGLGDAPGALALPMGGEFTYVVPKKMSVHELVAHAELLLVELFTRAPDRRGETRKELDAVLAALPANYRSVVDLLAHDMKALDGVEEPDGTEVPPDFKEQVVRCWRDGDFAKVLQLVRAAPMALEEAPRAHARGRGWSATFPRAAALFFEQAAETGGAAYSAALFEALHRAGRTVDAAERAREAIHDASSVVQVAALRALYLHIQFMPTHQRAGARRALVETSDRVLAGLSDGTFGTHQLTAAVRVLRGFAFDHLNDPEAALAEFEAAVTASPENVAARAARGIHLASAAPARAIEDLRFAFAAKVPVVDVGGALAALLLRAGDYEGCRRVCERALASPSLPGPVEAGLRERLAICVYEEGPSHAAEALHHMERAAQLAPDDERIRGNLAALVRTLAGEPANMKPPPLPDPAVVGDRAVAAELPQVVDLAAA